MLLSIQDVARQLQIKPSTLYAWAARGKIPHLKIHGLLRFDEQEIAGWLESFRTKEVRPGPARPRRGTPGDPDHLIARARREVYTPRHGETRPTSSLIRKGETDGAL